MSHKEAIQIRACTQSDIPLLIEFYRQFLEDERPENPRDLEYLEVKEKSLEDHCAAFFFVLNKEFDEKIIGYAVCDMSCQPIYLRQFFIVREERRKGFGTCAFQRLLELLDTDKFEFEVLLDNEPGVAFWKSVAFKKRS